VYADNAEEAGNSYDHENYLVQAHGFFRETTALNNHLKDNKSHDPNSQPTSVKSSPRLNGAYA